MGMGRRRVAALAVIALIAVSVVVPVGLMYRRLHPDRVPVDDDPGRHGIGYAPVSFVSPIDRASLEGWYMASPHPTGRAIVIAPGLDNNRLVSGIALRLAPGLLAAGFDVLTFDLRGEGESGGQPITFGAREQSDVLGAVREARAHGDSRVGVLGFSLGGASAILAAASSPEIDAVVAESSFADLTDTLTRELEDRDHLPAPIAAYGLALYRALSGTDPAGVSPERAIAAIAPRPILLIQGPPMRRSRKRTATVSSSPRRPRRPPAGWSRGGRHAESYFADEAGYLDRVASFFDTAMPSRGS